MLVNKFALKMVIFSFLVPKTGIELNYYHLLDIKYIFFSIDQVSLNPVQILNQGAEEERAETARLVSCKNI